MKKLLPILIFFLSCQLLANDPQPVELGQVHWLRNMNEAQAFAQQKDRPIFVLFQEVPGCATCRNYGQNVLSHPLIVEAIETLFIPLAIYNNKQGEDAKVLKYFKEPSWNNPVVRIVDNEKQDIIPRVNGNYSQLGIVDAMLQALHLSGTAAPKYLELLAEELRAKVLGTEKATFSMYCFWTGEGTYGKLDGVIATKPGFMDGREVVEVEYNPGTISYEELMQKGQKARCASKAYTHSNEQQQSAQKILGSAATAKSFKPDREPKYYLSKTAYRFVPMTPTQAARANSLVGANKSPADILSARQLELYKFIKAHAELPWKNVIGQELRTAWKQVEKIKA